ncbi:hypothetical protein E2C01_048215 [Portunus trituberculatus]|uniref:Uncharacterized protein n=1 Tax=Portunus trituberculatus TaxID=210409 RepID=A0A5B7GA44_PORTR|nr:hypothetical protein [Portunus trituberculatus]
MQLNDSELLLLLVAERQCRVSVAGREGVNSPPGEAALVWRTLADEQVAGVTFQLVTSPAAYT